MNDPDALHWLTSDDIARMTHRARQAGQPGWTGTSGTLAADAVSYTHLTLPTIYSV